MSKKERNKLNEELKKARQRGDLTTVNRILSVMAVAEGESDFGLIAKLLRVSAESVRQWLRKYLLDGVVGLIARRHSPGRPPKLTKNQRRELDRLICMGPEAAGFPGACWRSPMIQDLIHRRFHVYYNVHYISQLLKHMGFSFQKAGFAVGGRDEENLRKRQEWLQLEWPRILAEARKKGALLLFGDEASFPQWGTLTYTWAKKGQQPMVKTSGIRRGYKVFGLVDYFSGRFFFQTQETRLNSESYQIFIQGVLAKTNQPIIIIHDRARYHTSKAINQFKALYAERLTMYELPPYSPDYNPIEKIWKKIKTDETHLHYFPTWESLTSKVEQAMLHFENMQDYILALFSRYKARA